ncbi:MerR family transcriptional regulator [Glycomyces niveus]|uniref:MerR family transcriptional regulator n=1 Tax=Glycomyces niveus TaxID=2820287 RepID=A0ABS3U2V5_9ACTN|nr:MerR family transcriptional regulator [Glycomyces sp. NEAU-S30]MBO3733099.1 MerR family transcriptional regulator [Glycomyces sp. NEAU-S30]
MDNDDLVPIGTAAKRTGVSVATLRYWDERGIVRPAARRGGQRHYGPGELHRLAVVRTLQRAGTLNLDEIAQLLHGPASGRDWRPAVSSGLERVHAQIKGLTEAAAFLEHALTCPGAHPVDECPVLRELVAPGRPEPRTPAG